MHCFEIYEKKQNQLHRDCLPILMHLHVMLHIMHAYLMLLYLMLFLCIMLFLAIDFFECFLFSCFVLGYCHIVCLFKILFCIMHSAFNLLVFLISCSNRYLLNGYVLSGEIALRISIFMAIIIIVHYVLSKS